MSRAVYATGILLLLLGTSVFAYKHFVLDMAIRPDRTARVWRVEMRATVRGEDRDGRVELLIPRSDGRQVLLDSQVFDDGLAFESIDEDELSLATWSGRVGNVRQIAYAFRVHLPRPTNQPHTTLAQREPADESWQAEEHTPQALRQVLVQLGIEPDDSAPAIVSTVFGFLRSSIETVPSGSEDARLVLNAREGSPTGRARLLAELLGAAGVEARLGRGLALPRSGRTAVTPFVEARVPSGWLSLFPQTDSPGDRPEDFVVLARGDHPVLKTSGIAASQLDLIVLREQLHPAELASFIAPKSAFWRAVSLYRLPVATQSTLKVLLAIPLATLIAAVFRNLLGIRTFGTFMPILIALSLRRTDLATGLALVSSVTLAGLVGRLLLDRLRLLFVPRICLLLCLVVVFITGLAQLGYQIQSTDLMSGLLFPIVILSMLIERVSVTILEEGIESTARLVAGSLLLTAFTYPVFQSEWLAHVFFGFPELIFSVMGVLVFVGGYTGYRISELWRFRSFGRTEGDPT